MHVKRNKRSEEHESGKTPIQPALLLLVRCLARAAAREFVDANRKDRADG